jgi:hypothetical protein
MADPVVSLYIKERKMITKSRLSAGLAIAGVLLLGTFVVSAGAEERHDQHWDGGHGGDNHRNNHYANHYNNHYDHDRGRDWHGGYYAPPPVYYGQPVYAPPPVVYGPALGIYLPGVSIGIR